MKICFAASSGGHWEELMCISEIASEHESFFVTERGLQSKETERVYLVSQINRCEPLFLLKFILLFAKAFKIIKFEKPDIVISTGALVAYPFCLIAKIFGSKIIYIESFARVYNGSITGRLVYPFADLFLVQWESLLKVYPKAKYVGSIF